MNVDGSCVTWSLMLMLSNSNAVLTVSMTAVSVEPEGLNKLVFIYVVFFVPLINKDNLNIIFTGRVEVMAKVMFLLVSVILYTWGGGICLKETPPAKETPCKGELPGGAPCQGDLPCQGDPLLEGKETPREEAPTPRRSPWKETPQGGTPMPRRPPEGGPPEGDPPAPAIWSMSSQNACYWNAFLSTMYSVEYWIRFE